MKHAFSRSFVAPVVVATLLISFGAPAQAARAAKPTAGEQKLCDLLKDNAAADNTVSVDSALAQALGKAAGKSKNKKLVKSARPLASLVKKQQQVGVQVQALISECERRGAAPGPLVPAAPHGFAVERSGDLYSVDLGTGVGTLIGPTGIAASDVEGLTFACDGELYAVDRTTRFLYTIDTATGSAAKVGTAGLGVDPADAGLSHGVDGRLFMADVNSGNLYDVDRKSGVAEAVGPLGGPIEISGMGTRDDGTIFGFDRAIGAGIPNQLVSIDPDTGIATVVGATGRNLNLVGLDFDALGVLWGVYNAVQGGDEGDVSTVFSLDPVTGVGIDGPDTAPFAFKSLAIGAEGCPAKSAKKK